jgi:phage baseplate assembly protein W
MAIVNTKNYSDFDVKFIPHPVTRDLVKKTGTNAVVQSVMDLVQLSHYEKPFHPEIGSNIRKLLFEPLDNITANLLSQEIRIVLGNFEPRVSVIDVFVQSNINDDGYEVTIEFSVISLPNPVSITVFLERLR